MRLPPIPGPRDVVHVLERVTGLLGNAEELLTSAGSLVRRIDATREAADEVVARTDGTVSRAEVMVDRLEPVLVRVEETFVRTDELMVRLEQVLGRTETVFARVDDLLARFEPTLNQLLPTLDRLAQTTQPREVDALVSLIDHLPMLVGRLENEILPVLETLGTVAPDLHDLLDTSQALNEMLGKLPGMGRVKERVERQQEEEGRG